jgi:AcrR family transcriptional regulator
MHQVMTDTFSPSPHLSRRQQELVQGAVRLLDREGMQGFTMRALAAEVGLSPMAAYKHFENQRELTLEVWAACLHALRFELEALMEACDDASEAYHAMLRGFVDHCVRHPHRFELLFNDPFVNEVRRESRLDEVRLSLWVRSIACLREAQAAGSIRTDLPPESLALSAYASVHGMSYAILSGRVEFTTDMAQRSAIELCMKMLREQMAPRT